MKYKPDHPVCGSWDTNHKIVEKTLVSEAIAEYFNAQPERVKKVLMELRACIVEVVPEAEELINYNIPAYALLKGGKREEQIMIAGYKNHVGLYPHPTTMAYFENELSDFVRGKGSVQFPLNQPLPKDLIIRMIKYRLSLLKV